jgi:phosphoribosylformylglycinamidine cyclo-ligase
MGEESKNKSNKPLTYRDAGVDINAGNELAHRLAELTRTTKRREVVSGIGGFAGIMAIPEGYREPLLVSGTDGVGTKLKIAFATGRHRTVGIDLVAMCINDILTVGAEPLFFLDYFATSKLDVAVTESVVAGIVEGCRQSGCSLLGGETAEMPDMYAHGEYDLAGFAVGVVERSAMLDGRGASAGDVVIGLPSSGLHSNGYSLARKVLVDDSVDWDAVVPELGRSLADELLEPTRIYVGAVKALRAGGVQVVGLAHITGGGLLENPQRCLPEVLAFRFQTSTWQVPKVMQLIADRAAIDLEEMRRTFNMGLGLVAVVPSDEAAAAVDLLGEPWDARVVGEIISRDGAAVELV